MGLRCKIIPGWENFRKAGGILSFVVPATVMLILFIARGIYPFGDRSFLFSDMYHQYMPFFSEFMQKIKAGEGLAYSYNVGIGSNFLALYVYYLASPLNWLAFLFPQEYLMEFMSYLTIIKIGLCGYTANVYLRKHFQTESFSVLLFSCFYALSGFMAAYNWNIMWLEPVILFPLIILGMERMVKEGRCRLYCVTLALCIFSNYYLSIMICIFLVLYFIYLFLAEKRSVRIVWNFILYSLLAGGMAAVLLIPEVCAILKTDFGSAPFPETIETYFSILDVLARHCMIVVTERGLDHWPNIYCGAAVLILVPLYVLNARIPMRRRFGYLAMAGVLLFAFSTNVLDFIWHGLNYPDSLPARQSFIYIFLVIVMCYEAFRHLDEMDEKYILYGYLASVMFILWCEKYVEYEEYAFGVKMLNLLFLTIYGIILYLYRTRKDLKWKRGLAFVAFVAVIAEVGMNTDYTSVGTTSRSAYLEQQEDYKSLLALIPDESGSGQHFYRIEKFTRKTKNDGILTGYPTASVFSSTLNSHVADLYEKLGMRHSKVYYCYDGATAFTSALLNIGYMFGEDGEEEGAMYSVLGNSGDVWLYESNYTLPFGYAAPEGYDVPDGYSTETIKLQNNMVMELGVEGVLFERVSGSQSGDDVLLTAEEEGYYYALVDSTGTRKITANVSNYSREYNDLKKGCILYLGYLKEGASVVLTNGDDEDDTARISLDIYRMNEEVLAEALAVLSGAHLTNVSFDSTNVSGEINMEEAGRLILSVPYESGWTILLDGEEVMPELFGQTLIAFDLEAGYHTLEMHYVPEGKLAGMIVSLCSIILLICLTLYRSKKYVKHIQ